MSGTIRERRAVAEEIERSRSATTLPTATALSAPCAADSALPSTTSIDSAAVSNRSRIRSAADRCVSIARAMALWLSAMRAIEVRNSVKSPRIVSV